MNEIINLSLKTTPPHNITRGQQRLNRIETGLSIFELNPWRIIKNKKDERDPLLKGKRKKVIQFLRKINEALQELFYVYCWKVILKTFLLNKNKNRLLSISNS